jgi:uncharacterized protein DUF1404
LRPSGLSIVAAVKGGWLAGPILLAVVLSPFAESWSRQSLVVHHFTHGLMVVAGALVGYQLNQVLRHPWPSLIAWLGLGAALIWHVLPLLTWAEATPTTHMFAHATLVAGGIALGWGVPAMSSTARAYLFIAANVVMWPLVLLQIAGAFSYSAFADQAPAAGLAELAAMSASWLLLAFWSPIRRVFDRPPVATAAQALVVTAAIAGWL